MVKVAQVGRDIQRKPVHSDKTRGTHSYCANLAQISLLGTSEPNARSSGQSASLDAIVRHCIDDALLERIDVVTQANT